MQAKQEHPVDQFIRKAAQQFEVPFDETHWQALETQLDAALPAGAGAGGEVLSAISNVVSVASIAFLLTLGATSMTTQADQVEPGKPANQVSTLIATAAENSPAEEKLLDDDSKLLDDDSGSQPASNLKSSVGSKTTETKKQDIPPAAIETNEDGGSIGGNRQVSQKYEEEDETGDFAIASIDRKQPATDVDEVSTHEGSVFPIEMDPYAIKSLRSRGMIYFGPTIAPEFNSVGLSAPDRVSGVAGFSLQYETPRGLLVGARVLYNKKRFLSPGEEFSPPDGYWMYATNGVIPEQVDGWCRMIDVPVFVGYNLTPNKRWNIIPQIGVSSYWITEESCTYEFENSNPGASEGWESKENSNYYLGAANFSIGIRRDFTRNLTVTAEPFLKIPITTIGWGNVNLYGTGTLISLSYKLTPP